jgi:hypothetical protein
MPVVYFFSAEPSFRLAFKLGSNDYHLVSWQSVVFPLANCARRNPTPFGYRKRTA